MQQPLAMDLLKIVVYTCMYTCSDHDGCTCSLFYHVHWHGDD